MAEFYYSSFKSQLPKKIFSIYKESDLLKKNVQIFRNYEGEHYECGNNSAYIIGTAQVLGTEKSSFIASILEDFSEQKIPIIQKELIGQFIILIFANDNCYIVPDFLNIRHVYYDVESGEVSSNIGAMSSFHNGFDNDYLSMEFKAMDKCLYPILLGSKTPIVKIQKLQICQYIVIGNDISIRDFSLCIDNEKITRAEDCAERTESLLSSIISKYSGQKAVSTITGGYDSRLISALCSKNIPNLELRISTIDNKSFIDLSIGTRVAQKLNKKLQVYCTSPLTDSDDYHFLTNGLSKDTNMIIMGMIKHNADYQIGFGGALGTELFSTLAYFRKKELIDSYVRIAKNCISNEDSFCDSFRRNLSEQMDYIEKHIHFKVSNDSDYVRLFQVFMTARFSSPLLSLSDIYGHDMEPYATFPIIEKGVQIPYEFQGDSKTFGRFYLIPKLIMKMTNYEVGAIESTHNQPLLPVSLLTLPHYIIGKIKNSCHKG